jgi:hypothetical protein
VEFGGKKSKGKALLETSELLFRGDFRLKIPLAAIKSVKAADGELRIDSPEGKAVFLLGPLAEKWAHKMLNPKSRLDKLGLKPGATVSILNISDKGFLDEISERLGETSAKPRKNSDCIFLGAESKETLSQIKTLSKPLHKAGAIWVVYPKGQKHITENDVLAAGRKAGLKDVKVVGFSPTHTALKFVIPLAQR